MLKKRIIPKLLLSGGRLVKYVRFLEKRREAANPVSAAKIYNDYGVDELILLSIDRDEGFSPDILDIVSKISEQVFMPLTVGGGVQTEGQIAQILRAGADKVSINTQAVLDPGFIQSASRTFGNQCITVSLDYKKVGKDSRVVTRGGREVTDQGPVMFAGHMQDMGCGEILLTSIDGDGTLAGYDLDMVRRLNEVLDVPLVVSGGCGGLSDCVGAFDAGASGVGISSLFLFTDHSPIKLRSHLASVGVDVRSSVSSRN